MDGIIYKGVGGFYTVKAENGALLICKPRGIFRKTGLKPLTGDRVRLAREAGADVIDEIYPRRSLLVRPPAANADQLLIVASTTAPAPGLPVLDRLTAIAIDRGCAPALIVTKCDLHSPEELLCAYRTSGIPAFAADAQGIERLRAMLPGKLSVFCGNSGVGKTTLLNTLLPGLGRRVGEISQKLGRGRHTTREVEIVELNGGLVADTPGFAAFDTRAGAKNAPDGAILADNLQLCFPEIKARIGLCRFSGCLHLAEAGCAVRGAVQAGEIAQSRYQNYAALVRQAKEAQAAYR